MNRCITKVILFSAFWWCTSFSATYFVQPQTGDDSKDGLSQSAALKTINQALSLCTAKESDTIRILPSPFPIRETIVILKKNYTPEKPLVIDGGGNWITGSEEIPVSLFEKEESGEDLYVIKNIKAQFPFSFLVINGKCERMGRARIFPNRELPKVSELREDQWTLRGEDLVVKIKKDYRIEEYQIERAYRDAGVMFHGGATSRNVIISNLNVKFHTNDGFNLHCPGTEVGASKNIFFRDVRSDYNWDQGISEHDTCEYEVSNALMIGNSTGIVNIQNSKSVHRDLLLADSADYDLYFYGEGSNVFTNCFIASTKAWRNMVWSEKSNFTGNFVFENSIFYHAPEQTNGMTLALSGIRATFKNALIEDLAPKPMNKYLSVAPTFLSLEDSLFAFNTENDLNFNHSESLIRVQHSWLSRGELRLQNKTFESAELLRKVATLPPVQTLGSELIQGYAAILSPAMLEKVAAYFDQRLSGKGFKIISAKRENETLKLELSLPVDVLSLRAGIRVFHKNGTHESAKVEMQNIGKLLLVTGLYDGDQVEVTEKLLSTLGPIGLGEGAHF